MIVGCALWCCFIPLFICQNERIALKQAKLQGRASRHCVIVDDEAVDREPIEELEGHIVFVSGDSTCSEQLQDVYFPAVATTNCVKLRRIVEMYQWVETEHKDDNYTEYRHNLEWADSQRTCPHGGPQQQNPPMPLPSSQRSLDDYRASVAVGDGAGEACAECSHGGVKLCAYYLGQFVRREMTKWKPKSVGLAEIQSCNVLRSMAQPQQSGPHWIFGPNTGIYHPRFSITK